jgi:hypothetical protein
MNTKSRKFMSSFLSASSVAAFSAGALLMAGPAFGHMSPMKNKQVKVCTGCKAKNNVTAPSRCGGPPPRCSAAGVCASNGGGANATCAGSCGCTTNAAAATCVCK